MSTTSQDVKEASLLQTEYSRDIVCFNYHLDPTRPRAKQADPPMPRTTIELKCVTCGTSFKKTLEERHRSTVYNQGEMIELDNACPNNCGGQWFTIQKQHSIRKFKKHYGQ